ncbi:Nitroreductase-like protein, partial [Pelagophyceae sp. CCMP2097]
VGQAAWAGQATMLAAQTFLFAAEAHGLATAPMEGFDAQRAGVYLKLPRRYRATLVVAAGYAQPDDGARSPRFDPDTVFFEDAFG